MSEVGSRKRPVALVTGAARRIGRAISLRLAGRGYAVALHCNSSRGEAEKLAREITGGGGEATVIEADLADMAAVEALMGRTARAVGAPTCLVNNAALFLHDEASDFDTATWQRHQAVNLSAPILLTRDLARGLPEGSNGAVINILDQRVLRPTPAFFSYGVTKAGLWAATQMLAQGLAPRVRVNAIGPGPVLPNVHQGEDEFKAQQRALPLQRGATPEEIAAAVEFILDQPAMTGQLLLLDGGQHLSWRTPDALLDIAAAASGADEAGKDHR
ncbi:MAG: SDR family oxidoreductase [Hyphomicrobiaceae bacterium]|nr:MAG: SDR family oxidoreductase [Hyphomicrobiaceae bacterium]